MAGAMSGVGFDYSQAGVDLEVDFSVLAASAPSMPYASASGTSTPRRSNAPPNAPTGPRAGTTTPRGRGRGRGRGAGILQTLPHFINAGRGGGIGYRQRPDPSDERPGKEEKERFRSKNRGAGDLSSRPLLRPVKFVKGRNAFDADLPRDLADIEMVKGAEDATEAFAHVPAPEPEADENAGPSSSSSDEDEEDDLDDINEVEDILAEEEDDEDANISVPSLSRLQLADPGTNADEDGDAEMSAEQAPPQAAEEAVVSEVVVAVEEEMQQDERQEAAAEEEEEVGKRGGMDGGEEEEAPLFVIDTAPSDVPEALRSHAAPEPVAAPSSSSDEEEQILYKRPPSTSRARRSPTPPGPRPRFSRGDIVHIDETLSAAPSSAPAAVTSFDAFRFTQDFGSPRPAGTGSSTRKTKKQNARERRRLRRAGLRRGGGKGEGEGMPRVGDSDVEWGSDGPPSPNNKSNKKNSKSEGAAGRFFAAGELDEELIADYIANTRGTGSGSEEELDADVLARFVSGVSGPGAAQVSGMDLEVERMMREEDGEDSSESESEEDGEEGEEEEEEEEDGEGESEEDEDEKFEFDLDSSLSSDEAYALGRARAREMKNLALDDGKKVDPKGKGKGKGKGKARATTSDEESDDEFFRGKGSTKWDEDEKMLAEMHRIIDEEDAVKWDRRSRKKFFRDLVDNDGYGDDWAIDPDDMLFALASGSGKKKKMGGVPPALQAQWEADRLKKADRKRARNLERLEFSLAKGGGGKKARKARAQALAGKGLMDLVGVNNEIRRFLKDLGKGSLSLPPMDKKSRKQVHVLAECYSLKSKSVGTGKQRFTTLIRTSRSGIGIDEARVARAVNAGAEGGLGMFYKGLYADGGAGKGVKKGGKAAAGPGGSGRNKEGALVGGEAKPIAEDNVGYRLLAMMGWTSGERIGVSGGLHEPLSAVIKVSKRGLGA